MDIMLKFNCIYYCYFCSFFGGFFILLHLLRCIGKKMQKSAFISVTVNTVVIPCRFQCEKDCFILITIIKQWCLIKVGSTLGGLCLFLFLTGWVVLSGLLAGSVSSTTQSTVCLQRNQVGEEKMHPTYVFHWQWYFCWLCICSLSCFATQTFFTIILCYNSLNVATSLEIIHASCSHL